MIWVRVNEHHWFLQLLPTAEGMSKAPDKSQTLFINLFFALAPLLGTTRDCGGTSLREVSFIPACLSLFRSSSSSSVVELRTFSPEMFL